MASFKINLVKEIYNCDVLKFGEFKLKDGIVSPYYFNLRNLLSNPNVSNKLAEYIETCILNYKKKNNEFEIDRISGVPLGSIPISTLVSSRMNLPMIMPRKKRKEYGEKNEIEGILNIGDEIVVIEDTLTTGKSVLETIKAIERNGGLVSLVVCIFDRDCGGIERVKEAGYNVLPIINVNFFCDVLVNEKIIDEFQYESILNFTNVEKNKYIKSLKLGNEIKISNDTPDNSLNEGNNDNTNNDENNLTYKNLEMFNHKLKSVIFDLIYFKKSNLCLSLNTKTWEQGKKILDACGKYVVIVKTNVQLYSDYSNNFFKEIREYAHKYSFLIIEDRNLSDIAINNWDVMNKDYFKMDNWANFVTIQGLTSNSTLQLYKEKCDGRHNINVCPLLVVELNTNNDKTICNKEYSQNCINILEKNSFHSPLIMCQRIDKIKNRIKCTPYVCLEGDEEFESIKYRSVEKAIIEDGNHLIFVDNDIIYCDEPEEKAKLFAEKSHNYFKEGFPDLYKDINTFEEEMKNAIEKLRNNLKNKEESSTTKTDSTESSTTKTDSTESSTTKTDSTESSTP